MIQNSKFLNALEGKNTDNSYPIWIMRQAGRYLPNYQKLRRKHSLKCLFTNPELAAEVACLPFEYFSLDAAIVFWDIVLVAEAIGFEVDYIENIGPVAKFTKNRKDIFYLQDTVRKIKKKLQVPLIGFCGGPFTVASYLVDDIKRWIYEKPLELHCLLEELCLASIQILKMQIEAGVNAIQIFESAANILSSSHLEEFSLYYIRKILRSISTLTIVFAKGSCLFQEKLSMLSANALSFDWHYDLLELRRKMPNKILQGNFDPDLLFAPKKMIEKTVVNTLQKMEDDPALIINLGHGIKPHTPLENVKWFVDCVKNFSKCSLRVLS